MAKTLEPKKKKLVNEDEVCVCFNLRKAARIVTQIYDDVMRPLGFRATQINLIGVISQNEPITVKHLADFMDADPTTAIRNLRLLEREGLIKIEEGEDRRERLVTLKEKGRQLLSKALPIWKKTQDRIAALVGRENLNHLLEDLSNALERIQKEK